MKGKTVRRGIEAGAPLTAKQRAELARLAAAGDAGIDYSEIPPSPTASAAPARRLSEIRPEWFRPVKQSTTVRIDADVLAWLRAQGRGYQTRLNAILREAMLRDGG